VTFAASSGAASFQAGRLKLPKIVTARCIWSAPTRKTKEGRGQIQCHTATALNMKSLVWTRGDMFPLDQLENRLKCPNCGSRQIKIIFSVPGSPRAQRKEGRGC
jgi:hypothetical protein